MSSLDEKMKNALGQQLFDLIVMSDRIQSLEAECKDLRAKSDENRVAEKKNAK
jgi:hypothetical protein